jgi:hypothetical protein
MIFFPVIELVDRYTIAKLKYEKTKQNVEELTFYQSQIAAFDILIIESELDQLYNIHKSIWSLESELKSGVENLLSLEEIGKRAIEIRNLNNQRIKLKNSMADKLGQGNLHEIKKDHLSE